MRFFAPSVFARWVAAVTCLWMSSANAVLLSADYRTAGDGLLTIDTSTGLQWLDFSATANIRASSIAAGNGGWMNEFQFATPAQVAQLVSNAGMTLGTSSVSQYGAAKGFISLFHATSSCITAPLTAACGTMPASPGMSLLLGVGVHSGQGYSIWSSSRPENSTPTNYGSMLVSKTLLTPTTPEDLETGRETGRSSMLRNLFLWTRELIEPIKPTEPRDPVAWGNLGIRGDAESIIRNDLLNNPHPELGDVGVWLETASPASIAHAVDLTGLTQHLSFDYTFLDAIGDLTVSIGGHTIYAASSSDALVGMAQQVALSFMMSGNAELLFELNGPTGKGVILADLSFGDLTFADEGWIARDHGEARMIYIVDEAQIATLNDAVATPPVPEASTWALVLAGLLAAAGMKRIRQGHSAAFA